VTSSFLAEMLAASRERAAAVRATPADRRPDPAPPAGRFEAALRGASTECRPATGGGPTTTGGGRAVPGAAPSGGLAVIAEVKRASPSRGPLAPGLDAAAQARAYADGGAAAVSILTEPSRFAGSLDDLRDAARAVDLPLLRKDFLVDPCQVREAASCGAAAVLLIVAALDDAALAGMLSECAACGLDALVECHDDAEVRRAVGAGARIVGINNRDLSTLEVDLGTVERLAQLVTGEALLVAESGVRTPRDAARMHRAGAHAVLVGEALVTGGGDLRETIAAFSSGGTAPRAQAQTDTGAVHGRPETDRPGQPGDRRAESRA